MIKQTILNRRILSPERLAVRNLLNSINIKTDNYEIKDNDHLVVGWNLPKMSISVNTVYRLLNSSGFRILAKSTSEGITSTTYGKGNLIIDLTEFELTLGVDARIG